MVRFHPAADRGFRSVTVRPDPQHILEYLLRGARQAGADAADAILVASIAASVSYRLGRLEELERAETWDLGLRVFAGERVAFVSSTDLSSGTLNELPERALAMAKLAPEDKFACLAPAERLAQSWPALDLEDASEPSAEVLIERAKAVEGAATAVPGITNSEGGGASFGRGEIALATSEGFFGRYAGTTHSIGVAVLAGEGTGMERDYDSVSARHAGDLEGAEAVGQRAGERTVARLNPRKAKSQTVPIVFEPRVASGLLGHFAGAISGASIARAVSFLKDSLGKEVFSPGIGIIDEPHRVRGLRSKPFDGEGVRNERMALIEKGMLKTWILDCASAKQLGLQTTGHAARGTGGPPSPSTTNLYMEPGNASPQELMADIAQGFFITELMGMGVDMVTGDYSRGASGFWIENGKITYPVAGVTIAGNLRDMFRRITPANDLVFRYGTNAPTLRVEGMTVAGE
jgi:PmbA protein